MNLSLLVQKVRQLGRPLDTENNTEDYDLVRELLKAFYEEAVRRGDVQSLNLLNKTDVAEVRR